MSIDSIITKCNTLISEINLEDKKPKAEKVLQVLKNFKILKEQHADILYTAAFKEIKAFVKKISNISDESIKTIYRQEMGDEDSDELLEPVVDLPTREVKSELEVFKEQRKDAKRISIKDVPHKLNEHRSETLAMQRRRDTRRNNERDRRNLGDNLKKLSVTKQAASSSSSSQPKEEASQPLPELL